MGFKKFIFWFCFFIFKRISRELFISWSEDIEKLFPSESKFLHYSPYKSVREEVRGADGTIVFKKRKINTSGALYEHYGYLKTKLRQQHLLEKVQLVEVVPEILRFTGMIFNCHNIITLDNCIVHQIIQKNYVSQRKNKTLLNGWQHILIQQIL